MQGDGRGNLILKLRPAHNTCIYIIHVCMTLIIMWYQKVCNCRQYCFDLVCTCMYMHVQMYMSVDVHVHVCSIPFLRRGGVGGR